MRNDEIFYLISVRCFNDPSSDEKGRIVPGFEDDVIRIFTGELL